MESIIEQPNADTKRTSLGSLCSTVIADNFSDTASYTINSLVNETPINDSEFDDIITYQKYANKYTEYTFDTIRYDILAELNTNSDVYFTKKNNYSEDKIIISADYIFYDVENGLKEIINIVTYISKLGNDFILITKKINAARDKSTQSLGKLMKSVKHIANYYTTLSNETICNSNITTKIDDLYNSCDEKSITILNILTSIRHDIKDQYEELSYYDKLKRLQILHEDSNVHFAKYEMLQNSNKSWDLWQLLACMNCAKVTGKLLE